MYTITVCVCVCGGGGGGGGGVYKNAMLQLSNNKKLIIQNFIRGRIFIYLFVYLFYNFSYFIKKCFANYTQFAYYRAAKAPMAKKSNAIKIYTYNTENNFLR